MWNLPRASVPLATLTARSSDSHVLQHFGEPPMTPTPSAAQSPSTNHAGRSTLSSSSEAAETTGSGSTLSILAAPPRLLRLLRLALSVALALDGEDLGVVREPVDERRGARSVREDRVPLGKRQVRGEYDGPLLVPAIDDLKEQVGSVIVVREVAHLVDAKHVGASVVLEPPLQRTRRVLLVQIEQQVGRGHEERAM